ncbi:hypothetical protein ACFL50_06765 [Candidatus Latescibacterota bacterium]
MKTNPKFVTKLFAAIDSYADTKVKDKHYALSLSQSAREIIKPLIEHHNGEWMHENDGKIYSNFAKPENAVNCAVGIQRALQDKPDLKLRIGIHTGDVKSGIGSGDIVASGIAQSAVLGGVCISDKVYVAVQYREDIKTVFIEDTKLEQVKRPVMVYALTGEGLAEPVTKSSADDSVSTTKPQPSIAVLPFINMSADPEHEYFCDGMTEEIINALTHVENLRVIARTSTFKFKGEKIDIRKIGEHLNVESILEGSVRKAGNRVRIATQLINVANHSHLWSENYDREMEDIFAIQDEISLSIVEALKIKLLKKEKLAIDKHYTDNIEAYNLYLKGLYHCNKRTEEGLRKCVTYCKCVLDHDADYAPAYAGLADAFFLLGIQGVESHSESFSKAKTAALEALELDQSLAEAHVSLGCIYAVYEHNWQKSQEHFRYALQLNPNLPMTHYWYAIWYLLPHKLYDYSLTEIKKALNLDPLSLVINTGIGWQLYFARKYDEAIPVLEKALELDQNFIFARDILGQVYAQQGMLSKAEKELEHTVKLSNRRALSLSLLGYTYAKAGKLERAEEVVTELEALSKKRFVSRYDIALVFAGMNLNDQAFSWLEKAYTERNGWLVFLNVEPGWDSIKSDERFNQLIEKIGLI